MFRKNTIIDWLKRLKQARSPILAYCHGDFLFYISQMLKVKVIN